MDPIKLLKILGAVASAAHTLNLDSDGAVSFDEAVAAIASAVTPKLPVKADGTPYTAADVHAAASAARAPWLRVLAKTSPAGA